MRQMLEKNLDVKLILEFFTFIERAPVIKNQQKSFQLEKPDKSWRGFYGLKFEGSFHPF